jgi:hypothetical protein
MSLAKMCPSLCGKGLSALLMALRQGKDDSVLRVLRADKFVVADDQEYETTRQMAHELDMF